MRFYGREKEIEILRKNREMSKNSGILTVITGHKHIGKTALIREFVMGGEFLYLCVSRRCEHLLCEELREIAKCDLGIELCDAPRFRDLFEQLLKYGEEKNFTFIIDEFQEFEKINSTVISGIQSHWTNYKSTSMVNLIICGTASQLMTKISRGHGGPLFSMADSRIDLGPFGPGVIKAILMDHNPAFRQEDLLFLYTVAGGVPKYIGSLMDSGATTFDKMLDKIHSPSSPFLVDGETVLASEFGTEYGTYFAILELIAMGKNTLGDINSSTRKESGTYLENLEKKCFLIKRRKSLFSGEKSRGVRWQIPDNYLRFYFKFISKNQPLIEFKRLDLLKQRISDGYAQYSGSVLEDYFREKLAEEEDITNIGSYWDRKGQNEIDIIALNDIDMTATVVEVKMDPKKADLKGLAEKAETIYDLKEFKVEYKVLSLKDM